MKVVVCWLLLVSLVLGAPMASSCQWVAFARSTVATVAGPVSDEWPCCCRVESTDPKRTPCDELPRCTCGPTRSLYSEPGVDRPGAASAAAAFLAAAPTADPPWSTSVACPLEALSRPPPVLTLLRLHCALTT